MTYSQGSICSPVVQLLDEFLHQGPNRTYQYLVFELLGPTLDTVLNDYYTVGDTLESEIVIKLSKQLLQAVAFLHKVGYSYGGISGYITLLDVYTISAYRNLDSKKLIYDRYKW